MVVVVGARVVSMMLVVSKTRVNKCADRCMDRNNMDVYVWIERVWMYG